MTRHQERQQIVRFSRSNPPSSEEEALETIDVLNEDVASIEAKLDHTHSDTFPSEEDYAEWRRKATAALGHTRRELKFLENWVRERQKNPRRTGPRSPKTQRVYDNLSAVAKGIRDRANELAEEIGEHYQPLYTISSQPDSVDDAHARMVVLTGAKQMIQSAFSEITAAWTQHPLKRSDMRGVKSPIQKILSQVEMEIAVVKGCIKTRSAQDSPLDWRTVCASALTRAVDEGFVLTAAEQAILEQIQN